MEINFGIDSSLLKSQGNVPVIWNSERTINAHMLLVGKSGTGKTYTLRKIINQLKEQSQSDFRIRIIDVHGDIDIEENSSSVKFSESSPYGFNPLAINPDPDFGGVRKRIQAFLGALNRTSRKLGPKQESVLRNLLLDLYAANGFFEKNPETWSIYDNYGNRIMHNGKPKKFPTLEDAFRYASFKQKAMFLGTSNKAVINLEDVNKKAKAMYSKNKGYYKAPTKEEQEQMKAELKAAGEQAIDSFSKYIETIETGMELTDLIKYDSIDTLKSVVDRLGNLVSSGIFKNQDAPFDPEALIWRYDVRAITNLDEKKLFVYFLLEEIFSKRLQEGQKSDVVELVILDEANLFFSDDADNIINIISKEARKFGLGLVCASQSPTHFSEDFISNVGTKIILGLDQMFWDGSVRKLKIEQQALEWIVPHKKMVIQINNKAELKNKFTWVYLQK